MVSVVIPALNAQHTLPKQLEALSRQTYGEPWEVVIADNGSSDDTVKVAQSFAGRLPALTVVLAGDRKGASHARNRGTAAARGELIAFCDADDVVSEGWLEALTVSALRGDQVAGVVEVDALGTPGARLGRHLRPAETPRLGFLPFAPTCSCAIWKEVFDELAGMNEEYLASHDVELSWRLQLSSKTLVFEPRALVHHRSRATLRASLLQLYRRGMGHVLLFRDFRARGMPRSWTDAGLAWGWLLVTAPLALAWKPHREVWVRRLGLRIGRLAGSVCYGTLYP
jgi:glycosyltransferase involved in cell wall biosynthesis